MSLLISKYKNVLLYGSSLALLLFALKWLELRLAIFRHSFEIYIGTIALLFTGLGIWLAVNLAKPKIKTVVIEKEVRVQHLPDFVLNEKEMSRLAITKRELEVLRLMAGGLSNQEIADKLFLSLPTIKTHSSRLFEKMDVERRTQAVDKGKKLGLIP